METRNTMRAAIVVPTIREDSIVSFLRAWSGEFSGHLVIIVEDNPERTFAISGFNVKHYCWADIDAELGSDSWIIPRRTDCVRSFGYYKAFEESVDIIVTLDDDCYPNGGEFLQQHYKKLSSLADHRAWVSTGQGALPRGMPYYHQNRQLQSVINHGLWVGVPDFDAVTQLGGARFDPRFESIEQVIPRGMFFPMCGMNLAFKPSIAPAMYFLLMGRDWPFDRFGDIWCGIFAKKMCDHLGLGVCSGEPMVEHKRASNVWQNLRKEAPGYEVNETLWRAVDSIVLTKSTVRDCYKELAEQLPFVGEYWDRLRRAMGIWADLYAEPPAQPPDRDAKAVVTTV
jgi:reversibly glycosylated polypeptide / UDP-arabinopyranose mutase